MKLYYHESVRSTLQGSGLEQPFLQLYRAIHSTLLPSSVSLSVAGVRANFAVSNPFEYSHFTELAHRPDRVFLADVLSNLRPDDTFWDVGANVGIFTVFAAIVLDGGTAVAIEPHPKNVERIQENLERNGLDAHVVQRALGASTGTVRLSVMSPDVVGAFSQADDRVGDYQVGLATGEALVAEEGVPPPTVLKVDVEGAEFDVLRGADRLLADDRCRLVYCNVYEKYFQSADEGDQLRRYLESHGFAVTRIADWNGGHFLRAERDGRN